MTARGLRHLNTLGYAATEVIQHSRILSDLKIDKIRFLLNQLKS